MVEANAQLGVLKLPEALFGQYENLIKLTHYNEFKKVLGEEPILHYKKHLISAQNQKSRGVHLQLADGSTPSFEQFKAIKEKIVRNNENPDALTPLAAEDKQRATVEQYRKLEELSGKHPGAAARIKKLQSGLDQQHLPA
jgi:hypothetical protein